MISKELQRKINLLKNLDEDANPGRSFYIEILKKEWIAESTFKLMETCDFCHQFKQVDCFYIDYDKRWTPSDECAHNFSICDECIIDRIKSKL